ncbi:succinylglutamate desuccinylase/aspartoacylase family protein [soil metagenome]
MTRPAFTLGTATIPAGTRRTVELPVSVLFNDTPMRLPVHVIHGSRDGPVLFLSGVVHGDEIQGAEIIRQVVRHPALAGIAGTLLAVPIVNGFGFISHSRYMPDRRDLNRSFPGSDHGSLASILADILLREVLSRAQYGIDLHTAGVHRSNLPQIRIAPDEPELLKFAEAFSPPVILVSKLREGTLRQCARDQGVRMLLYEAGEALRFDDFAIRTGVVGILRSMRWLAMIPSSADVKGRIVPVISQASLWLRAPEGGILHAGHQLGDKVGKNERIGVISDPLGDKEVPVIANETGIVIGRTNLPIVNRGDALFHIARVKDAVTARRPKAAEAAPPDEDEII